eukprot:10807725-Heterocapsa_arctica.AAC.1
MPSFVQTSMPSAASPIVENRQRLREPQRSTESQYFQTDPTPARTARRYSRCAGSRRTYYPADVFLLKNES